MIGEDVSQFAFECLNNNSFPPGLGEANIVLLPKKPNLEAVTDRRPIALCNTSYKIIAKVLANRMKGILRGIIVDTQCAFVPNRLITDNIIITAETGHYLHNKRSGTSGWAGLKLDMAKAYDRMKWNFLRFMLQKFGFDSRWIEMVMLCVESTRYNFKVNDDLIGPVVPTRGLRQGDPLSPYLFIICAEGLSLLFKEAQMNKRIHGCRVARGAPAVTHLMFADDVLVLFKANRDEANEVKQCLKRYESASSQVINFHKSCISFSTNIEEQDRVLVSGIFQVQQSADFGKYLGLPSIIGWNRKDIFKFVEQKLQHRIGS